MMLADLAEEVDGEIELLYQLATELSKLRADARRLDFIDTMPLPVHWSIPLAGVDSAYSEPSFKPRNTRKELDRLMAKVAETASGALAE